MTDTPIKVAQILAGAPVGGAENLYTRQVSALAKYSSIEQKAFTRENQQRVQQLTNAGVQTSLHRFAPKWQLPANYGYRKALKQWHPDVVLTYMNRASAVTPKGNYVLASRLGNYYDLKHYRHCDYWIGITKGICDHLVRGGIPSNRIFQIPNFVEEKPQASLARESFATPNGSKILFALGRLHQNKGFDILIKALTDIPDTVLWLAGEGPEEAPLKQLVSDLKLTHRVKFLGWRTDVNALMSTADVFICPSRHEGLGSIILEAWYNHCPMVATASQGPGELIDHEQTGLLTPIDDVDSLSAAIRQLLEQPDDAKRLSENGYKNYQEKYSETVICQQYLDFFKEIV